MSLESALKWFISCDCNCQLATVNCSWQLATCRMPHATRGSDAFNFCCSFAFWKTFPMEFINRKSRKMENWKLFESVADRQAGEGAVGGRGRCRSGEWVNEIEAISFIKFQKCCKAASSKRRRQQQMGGRRGRRRWRVAWQKRKGRRESR